MNHYDQIADELNAHLAQVLKSQGLHDGIAGNIYHYHEISMAGLSRNPPPQPQFEHKRERLVNVAKRIPAPCVLEVGINGGHSAMLMLEANPALQYHGVDNATATLPARQDVYVPAAMEWLRDRYPGRVNWSRGNSTDVLPYLPREIRYDIVHYDACKELYYSDFMQSRDMLNSGAIIVVDDTTGYNDPGTVMARRLVEEGFATPDSTYPDVRDNTILLCK